MNHPTAQPQKAITPERASYELDRREVRERCKNDLFFLANSILRDPNQPGHVELGPIHKEMADDLQAGGELCGLRDLSLWPRSHLKTTVRTVAYAVFRILRNPRIRILILNAIEENAQAFLGEVRNHFKANPRLRELFPELIPEGWGDKSHFKVKTVGLIRGSSVEAIGVGGSATSKHFDLIIYDDFFDLADPRITDPGEHMRKVEYQLEQSYYLLDSPKSDQVMTGTRWAVGDPYEERIKSGKWNTSVRTIETDGVPIWPEKFPIEIIREKLKEATESGTLAIVYAQWYNDPVPAEEAKLRGYKLYEGRPPEGTKVIIGIDPASSVSIKADYTAIVSICYTPAHEIYVDVAVQQRVDPSKIVDMAFDYERLYSDRALLAVEAVAAGLLSSHVLKTTHAATALSFS